MKRTILIIGLLLLLIASSGCINDVNEEKAPPEDATPEDVSPAAETAEPGERQAVSGEVTITGELAGVGVGIHKGAGRVARYYFPAIIEDSGHLSLLYFPDHVILYYYEEGNIIRADTTIGGYTYTHDGVAGGSGRQRIAYSLRYTRYGIRITVTGHLGTFDRTPLEMSYWEDLEKAGVRDEDGWTYPYVKRAIHGEDIEVLTSWDWDELVRQGEAGVERLIQALNIPDGYIGTKVAESLLKIGEPAVEPLIQALKDEKIQFRVTRILGKMGDKRAVEPLVQALLKDEKEWFRRGAVDALVKIGDPRVVEPLIQVLKDEDEDRFFREYAAETLGELGDLRAVESLIQALEDDDPVVRRGAAWALGEIGDERAVEPLIQALKDESSGVRRNVVDALGEIGDERAVEPLKKALNDESLDMRKAIWDAIEKIKG